MHKCWARTVVALVLMLRRLCVPVVALRVVLGLAVVALVLVLGLEVVLGVPVVALVLVLCRHGVPVVALGVLGLAVVPLVLVLGVLVLGVPVVPLVLVRRLRVVLGLACTKLTEASARYYSGSAQQVSAWTPCRWPKHSACTCGTASGTGSRTSWGRERTVVALVLVLRRLGVPVVALRVVLGLAVVALVLVLHRLDVPVVALGLVVVLGLAVVALVLVLRRLGVPVVALGVLGLAVVALVLVHRLMVVLGVPVVALVLVRRLGLVLGLACTPRVGCHPEGSASWALAVLRRFEKMNTVSFAT